MSKAVKEYTINYSGDIPPANEVKKGYEKILKDICVDFDTDIELVVCHGNNSYIPEDMSFDKLYIFVQCAPPCVSSAPSKLEELNTGDRKIKITGGQIDSLIVGELPKIVKPVKDKNDQIIALLHDSSIYFLNDFIHCNSKDELDRSLETFKFVFNELTKDDTFVKGFKCSLEEKSKKSLEVVLHKQFNERIKKEELALESSSKLVDEYLSKLVQAQRKVVSTESILKSIRENLVDMSSALNEKWESTKRLTETPLFESISFAKNSVSAITTPIYLEEKKTWYRMGKFEIKLDFSGGVKIFSLSPEVKDVRQQHPHVNDSGGPCWGNLSGELPKRIAESEFDVAFVEVHTFLCHYSQEGGPYANISHWQKADPKEVEEWKEKFGKKKK